MAPHPTLLAAVGVVGLACILQIFGVATPNWLISPSDLPVRSTIGLWEFCRACLCESGSDDVADWLKVTRAFGIIAILVMGASMGCGALFIVKPEQAPAQFRKIPPLLSVAGTVTSIISFAVFAGKIEDLSLNDAGNYGYSFIVCVVAAVLSGLSAALYHFSQRFQND